MPSKTRAQAELAETTYQESVKRLQRRPGGIGSAKALVVVDEERVLLERIAGDLTAYNDFSIQMRQAAQAGDVKQTVTIVAVSNLKPSNDLPIAFSALHDLEVARGNTLLDQIEASGSTGTRAVVAVSVAGMLILLGLLLVTVRRIVGPLKRTVDVLSAVASGDLTQRLAMDSEDEVGQMAASLDLTLDHLSLTMGTIAESATTLAGSSGTLTAVSTQMAGVVGGTSRQALGVAAAAEQVSANVESVAAASEQMSASISEIARAPNSPPTWLLLRS